MKNVKALICATLLAATLFSPAHADRASLLLGSHHFGGSGFEEVNPGIFYTWEERNVGFTAGAFRNSYGRGAAAATAAVPLARWTTGELTVFAGAAYYRIEGRDLDSRISGDVIGIGGLQLRQGHVFAQLIPMNDRGSDVLVTFGLTWNVDRRNRR